MRKRSAIVIAGMLVSALLAGVVSRTATLTPRTVAALKPSAVVIQQSAPTAPISGYQGESNDF
jgi:hypothetical protein